MRTYPRSPALCCCATSQACLDLLEMKGTGVFSMIDEEINVPKGSDEGFKSKLLLKHAKVRLRAPPVL
jgi:myosin heavy subunit